MDRLRAPERGLGRLPHPAARASGARPVDADRRLGRGCLRAMRQRAVHRQRRAAALGTSRAPDPRRQSGVVEPGRPDRHDRVVGRRGRPRPVVGGRLLFRLLLSRLRGAGVVRPRRGDAAHHRQLARRRCRRAWRGRLLRRVRVQRDPALHRWKRSGGRRQPRLPGGRRAPAAAGGGRHRGHGRHQEAPVAARRPRHHGERLRRHLQPAAIRRWETLPWPWWPMPSPGRRRSC